jgi:hypothetical protein
VVYHYYLVSVQIIQLISIRRPADFAMKVLCLYIRHGTEKYPGALSVLDQWYERHGLLGQRTLWIIDNALNNDQPPKVLAPGVLLRAGDNQAWEFSAWARAVREAEQERVDYDVIHFVTSAFNTLYTVYLSHFRREMLSYVFTNNVYLGHIDNYNQPIELAGQLSNSWIRTCFFFLPAPLAYKISTWAQFTDQTRFFSSTELTQFRDDSPLSTDYQNRIRIWLEGQDVGGHTWHSPIRSGHDEAKRFQKKALAILNEHNLSITLRKMNIPLVDFCWLWSRDSLSAHNQVMPPDEMAQLAVRRRILGIAS